MADGALTLILDDATVARLAEAAALAGQTPEAYAADRLAETLSPPLAYDWTEANERLTEYDRTGEYVTLEDALASFHDEVEAALAARR